MSQIRASADFVLQNRHTGGFYCCFPLLAVCRQVQKLYFMLRAALTIMPQHHFSTISNICRHRASGSSVHDWESHGSLQKKRSYTLKPIVSLELGKKNSFLRTPVCLFSPECLFPVSKLSVLPRGMLLVVNCCGSSEDHSSLVLLLCS